MTKTSPMAHYDRHRRGTQDTRSNSNFSKEYAEYWKRPSFDAKNSNFAVEKNAYTYPTASSSPTKTITQYSNFSSAFR
ncbi:hypothetical protein Q1695_007277 [Nippostrongylus brasiliensis]|nr:hypothetical protein Q1695_007277 [Nippostrongylus brasiliensis]